MVPAYHYWQTNAARSHKRTTRGQFQYFEDTEDRIYRFARYAQKSQEALQETEKYKVTGGDWYPISYIKLHELGLLQTMTCKLVMRSPRRVNSSREPQFSIEHRPSKTPSLGIMGLRHEFFEGKDMSVPCTHAF